MEKHEPLFKDARQWIKETSQSCSAVAVLVATVVFAAAYTIPGGANDNGFPIFLDNPIFIVFTVMYVVALCNILAVCIFALVEFPLYVAVKGCVRTILKTLKKIIPRFLLN
ncbi:Ankyrin repeat-containing protein [Glycine soja]|uniref:Ankyrin repeat-containing protein n=1 Tax=Glycine soja TaxID=3848 RepID=A0A0B2R4S2_GLYSO|nr:Ankyrin repeat-containing protein [Glycine soja]